VQYEPQAINRIVLGNLEFGEQPLGSRGLEPGSALNWVPVATFWA
jgi:hypothetical protein